MCQAKSGVNIQSGLGSDVSKDFSSRCSVTTNSVDALFTNLHARGRQLDQPFQESTNDGFRVRRSPKAFPLFVSFPVVTAVKQVDRQQKVSVFVPGFRSQSGWRPTFATVTVTVWMTDRVRRVCTRNIRIRWEHRGWQQSRNLILLWQNFTYQGTGLLNHFKTELQLSHRFFIAKRMSKQNLPPLVVIRLNLRGSGVSHRTRRHSSKSKHAQTG